MFNPLRWLTVLRCYTFSVHAVLLFVQEKPERRRGSVRSHFGGSSRNQEVSRHIFHRKLCVQFFPLRLFKFCWYCRRDNCVQLYIGQLDVPESLATLLFSTFMSFARAPGNIVDWVYKRMGVKYSFAAHLRDTGTVSCLVCLAFHENWLIMFHFKYGFALPEQWIRPVGEETAKMVEYLADFITGKECH